MKSADDVIRALMMSIAMNAVIRNAPTFLAQFHAVRARLDVQPSPATYYLNQWHNR